MTPAEREQHRQQLQQIYRQALHAVNGRLQVSRYLQAQAWPQQPVAVIAIGKAASEMAAGAADYFGAALQHLLVITKHGHLRPDLLPAHAQCIEAGHPVPDAQSLIAGQQLLDFIAALPEGLPVVSLISGGASAVVEVLAPKITLADLQRVNQRLLGSGLDIHAMNRIRKSLSAIKGGRLASYLTGHAVHNLLISDVPNDDLASIGSGVLIPHQATALPDNLPDWLQQLLTQQLPLAAPECYENIVQHLLTTPATARHAAANAAQALGYAVHEHAQLLTGDAVQTALELVEFLRTAPTGLHIWSGETTVQLPENAGEGGRCQSLALAAANQLLEQPNMILLAAGTDGNDGPGDVAGALVDCETVVRGQAQGLDAVVYLQAANAGRYLHATDSLLITGPTGTNVMDLMLGLC